MNNLFPFFVPGCGLLFTVVGAWGLLSPFRRAGGGGGVPAGEPTSDALAVVEKRVRTSLRIRRISGLFWFCLGAATLWYYDIHRSWSRPDSWIGVSVGLFWMVAGTWEFLLSIRRGKQTAIARQVAALVSRSTASNARARGRARIVCVLLLGLGIALVSFSGIRVGAAPAVVSQPRKANGRLAEIVTQHVERAFKQEGHVGLVVGAIARGEETLLGFGARGVGDPRPPDAETVFEIGSMTKVFTGILLAQQIEDGELKLDDRIAELLPKGWSLSESARAVTLRHCTTQTSGFPRLPDNLIGIAGAFRLLLCGDPYRDYSEEDLRDALATVELEFKPGTRYGYSNFAVGLLGFVLATQNGSDYETLVTSKICKPLGMRRTVIRDDEWLQKHMPSKYRATLRPGPVMLALESDEWRISNPLAGAGAIRSTGRDLMTFLKANMGLIPTPIDGAIRRSHQELFQESPDRALGMNWIRSYESALSQKVLWHNGGTGGFSTYLGFTEDRQFGVFVLSNTTIRVDALAEGILKGLVRKYAPETLQPNTIQGSAKPAPDTGARRDQGPIRSGSAGMPPPSVPMRVQPIDDREPETTKALKELLAAALGGPVDPDLFTKDAQRARLPAKVEEVGKKIARLGPLVSFDLIARTDKGGWRTHRYRAVLGETGLVVTFALAGDGKIGGMTIVPE